MRNKRLIIIFSILLVITMSVLLGSIIFSVKTVGAYCYNYAAHDTLADFEGQTLSDRVLAASRVEKGKSIFFLDEKEIINAVHNDVADVMVINVERKFPNRVVINYIRMYSYFEIASGGFYYTARHDGIVTNKSNLADGTCITIKADIAGEYNVGEQIFTGTNAKTLGDIILALEMLDLAEEAANTLFDFIDLTVGYDTIYLGLRSGVVIKLMGKDDLLYKLNLALTIYSNPEEFNPAYHKMIIVAGEHAYSSPENDYSA